MDVLHRSVAEESRSVQEFGGSRSLVDRTNMIQNHPWSVNVDSAAGRFLISW